MRCASILPIMLLTALASGCLDATTSTTSVNLQVSGIVRDSATGGPIAGASVALLREEDLTSRTVVVTQTGTDGKYTLTYKAENVVADKRFSDQCAVWDGNATRNLDMQVSAHGYTTTLDGLRGAPTLRCVNEAQVINFTLAPANPS